MTNKFYSYYFYIEDYIGINSHFIIDGYIEVGLVLFNDLNDLKSTTCDTSRPEGRGFTGRTGKSLTFSAKSITK